MVEFTRFEFRQKKLKSAIIEAGFEIKRVEKAAKKWDDLKQVFMYGNVRQAGH